MKRLLLCVLAALALLVAAPSGAWAAEGTAITYVEPTDAGLQLLVSVPADAEVDLDNVAVTVDGQDAESAAELATDTTTVRRTSVLAIDTSNSMRGARFDAAKSAAKLFLASVPEDVYVGIVTFDNGVTEALAPTQDRAAAEEVIDSLDLALRTSLNDGVIAGVEMAGAEGQRSILVLSDGADTSETPLEDVTAAITEAEVLVNVVALEQGGDTVAPLQAMATAGEGQVISADSAALEQAFSEEADVLARQILITAQVPESVTSADATVAVSLPSGEETLTAEVFAPIGVAGPGPGPVVGSAEAGIALPDWAIWAALGMVGLGLILFLGILLPSLAPAPMTTEERVGQYALARGGGGARKAAKENAFAGAKDAAAQMLEHSGGLDVRIGRRLESAGSALKPSEWLLVHAGIAVGAGVLGLLLGGGNVILGILFIAGGIIAPWLYLGFRKSRRTKAFNALLPDTLQLMSGSLSAGLSLAQSVDTIVREGSEPMAGEFKRVLVETRLGVSLEDALEGITERFDSKDFAWVVMAIKIQRQVGGNLAELLDTVSGTIREREYLRRQVNTLAAEGKLSAWVLGGLPPGFLVYLILTQGDYVSVLWTDPRGWVILGSGIMLLSVGAFWMSRLVKVDV